MTEDEPRPDTRTPPFLLPYLPQFRALLDDLDLVEDFLLFPVQLSGHDLARGLAEWLTANGRRAHLVAPVSEGELRDLAPSLLNLNPAPQDIVVFAGPPLLDEEELPPGLAYGFHLLNQRRDSIKRQLKVPLLWCGPKGFQAATAVRAPDFWSIRDLGGKLKSPEEKDAWRLPGTLGLPYLPLDADENPERLRELYQAAKLQNNPVNAARIAIRLANLLRFQLELEEGIGLCDEALADLGPTSGHEPLRAMVFFKKAELLLGRGAVEESAAILQHDVIPTLEGSGRHHPFLQALMLLAETLKKQGRYAEALKILQKRVFPNAQHDFDAPEQASLRLKMAMCLDETGHAGEAERILTREVLPVFKRSGDARSQAVALDELARIYALQGRLDEAIRLCQREVLPTLEAISDRAGQISARSNLAMLLIRRGKKSDLLDARTLLAQALRGAQRHHLSVAASIREELQKLDEMLKSHG